MTNEQMIDQLKAKEQENEALKQRLHQCWTVENSFVEQLDKLKVDYNKSIKTLTEIEEYCKDCNLKTDYTACAVLHIIDKGEVL